MTSEHPHDDPPDLAVYASRDDYSMHEWPGSIVSMADAVTVPDSRDHCKPAERLLAIAQLWQLHLEARERGEARCPDPYGHGNTIIAGHVGNGIRTLATMIAAKHFAEGRPVFSNAGLFFGWRVNDPLLFTGGHCPRNAVIVLNADTMMSSRAGPSVSVIAEMLVNSRKQGHHIYILTHADYALNPHLRRDAREVLIPQTERPPDTAMAWRVYSDYPYREGIGQLVTDSPEYKLPPYTMEYTDAEAVRRAHLFYGYFQHLAPATGRMKE